MSKNVTLYDINSGEQGFPVTTAEQVVWSENENIKQYLTKEIEALKRAIRDLGGNA